MYRFTFALTRPFIDAASAEEALKNAINSGALKLTQGPIPQKVRIECMVTPKPNPTGQFTATAYHGAELIASCDAPSGERALLALGLNNPAAHTCSIYKRRFGDNYELVLRKGQANATT